VRLSYWFNKGYLLACKPTRLSIYNFIHRKVAHGFGP